MMTNASSRLIRNQFTLENSMEERRVVVTPVTNDDRTTGRGEIPLQ